MAIKINNNNLNNCAPSFRGASGPIVIGNKNALSFLEWSGGLSSPANRFLLGATALAIQPSIDLNNKKVDEQTRIVSAARTMAKIIAGTVTGVIIRAACIRYIDKWTDVKAAEKGTNHALLPSSKEALEKLKVNSRLLKNHKKALGTCIALLVMLFTNFAFDIPITKFLTNVFTKKFQKAGEKKTDEKGGNA